MEGSMMFLVVRLALMLGVIVGRVATTFFIPSIDVLPVWIVLAMSCSVLFYVTNLLYNSSNLSLNKLRL